MAFVSQADNLSAADDNTVGNVFVRDLIAGTTILVSRAAGAAGAGGDAGSFLPAPSADGRVVAFSSLAGNLSDADADAVQDVFVRDVIAATTTLVSRASGVAGAGGDSNSFQPSISSDGRYVAFDSAAGNLSADAAPAPVDIYVRDLTAAATALGSRAAGPGGAGGDASSIRPVIAALGGADVVRGLGGADRICLGAGPDRAIAGAGDDRVVAAAGSDIVDAGAGRDLVDAGAGADLVRGGSGADRLRGGAGPDRLFGDAGPDRLLGQGGRDRAVGGAGGDVCQAERAAAC